MSLRVLLELIPKRNYVRSDCRQNLRRQLVGRSYNTAHRTELTAQENFERKMDFEHFKDTQVKSFEKYQESPIVKELFEGDMKKISKAYEDYCLCKFNKYNQTKYGGNPSTAL